MPPYAPDRPTVDPVILTTKSALVRVFSETAAQILHHAKAEWDRERAAAPGFGYVENDEAMRLLNLSRPTLARYRKAGTLPFSRVGSKVYYRVSDIEALMERSVVRSEGDSAGGLDVPVLAVPTPA